MTKEQLRDKMKQLRSQLTPKEREQKSSSIQNLLFDTKAYQECEMIFIFISFGDEVDTLNILERAFLDHKRIFVPRIDQKCMEFYEIKNLNSLIKSKFGILEPRKEEETRYISKSESNPPVEHPLLMNDKQVRIQTYDLEKMKSQANLPDRKLMVMPGLAFDHYGNRIGYGAGYYDKYLANHQLDHFNKIALAYEFQVLDKVPAEEFDEKTDVIITPVTIIQCRP